MREPSVLSSTRNMARTALIAVDVQNDYLPDGPLGIPGSDSIIEPLVEYATLVAEVVILSRTLHPPDRDCWAACIKGSTGAKIVPDLAALGSGPNTYVTTSRPVNYSAFEGGTLRPLSTLEDILTHERVTHVTVGGYWLEYRVAQTALDANALGYDTVVDPLSTFPFDEGLVDDTIERLARAGVAYA